MKPCDINNKKAIEDKLRSTEKWVADRNGKLIVESKKNRTRIEVLAVDPKEPGRAFGAFKGILVRLKEKFNITPTQGNLSNGNWADIVYTNEVFEDIKNTKKNNEILYKSKDSQVNYSLKAVDILSSDKAKQIFAKGEKNGWSLDKILTELTIPKEQKGLVENIYNNKINNILKTLEKNCE